MPTKHASKPSQSHAPRSESQRGLWKGSISFGLVNIPVKLMSAKERADLHFSMVDPKTFSPIGYKYYNKSTGREVSRGKTVKAYKATNGKFVVMTEADFRQANPKATDTIDIEGFVDLDAIDPVFFKQAYYLLPTKAGQKGYRLLGEALSKKGKVGIAKIVLHTKQHLAAIIPRGDYLLLELLNFAEDVKELKEIDSWKSEVSDARLAAKEVAMAERLVDEMSEHWKPEQYKNTYRADLMKRVQAKIRAGKATELTEDAPESEEVAPSNIVDLMPLLQKSLEKHKPKRTSKAKRRA